MTSPFIETFTGVRFSPLRPRVEDIRLEDIAHALSNQCRFSGHPRVHYSVAEHAVRVSWILEAVGASQEVQFWGLHHDDSEYGLVDLPSPIKHHWLFGFFYRRAERKVQRTICRAFGLPEKQPPLVSWADAVMLATEVRDLMANRPEHWGPKKLRAAPWPVRIEPWSPREAEEMFLRRHWQLTGIGGFIK